MASREQNAALRRRASAPHPGRHARTTLRCSMSAPSSRTSLQQLRWPAGAGGERRAGGLAGFRDLAGQGMIRHHEQGQQREREAAAAGAPLPAASRSGGSPQWSDSLRGAPCNEGAQPAWSRTSHASSSITSCQPPPCPTPLEMTTAGRPPPRCAPSPSRSSRPRSPSRCWTFRG